MGPRLSERRTRKMVAQLWGVLINQLLKASHPAIEQPHLADEFLCHQLSAPSLILQAKVFWYCKIWPHGWRELPGYTRLESRLKAYGILADCRALARALVAARGLHPEIRWNFCLKPDERLSNESAGPKNNLFSPCQSIKKQCAWGRLKKGGKEEVILHNQ